MLLLALDTSSPAVSVAVHDGAAVIAEASEIAARRHGELLAPMVRDVLKAAGARVTDISDVVVGTGPGPYTSLRIGLVTARALALALAVPAQGVCSLDALARDAVADEELAAVLAPGFLVATDARRREVYWAAYDPAGVRLCEPGVGPAGGVREAYPGLPVIGAGAALYPDDLGPALGPSHPRAGGLAEIAVAALARGDALPTLPLYLRRPDAAQPGERKPVLR